MLDNVLCAAAWCVYNEKRYFAAAAIYQLLWGTCPRGERNTQLFSVVPPSTPMPHSSTKKEPVEWVLKKGPVERGLSNSTDSYFPDFCICVCQFHHKCRSFITNMANIKGTNMKNTAGKSAKLNVEKNIIRREEGSSQGCPIYHIYRKEGLIGQGATIRTYWHP